MSPTTAVDKTFLDKLRIDTQDAHKALEQLPISQSIVDPKLTIEQYGAYLGKMRDVHHDVETKLFPLLSDIVADLPVRTKTSQIEADLLNIGLPATHLASDPITQSSPIRSKAFAMGVLYVIEGSSLGGRIILKNIQSALGLDKNNGANYFYGYGEQTGSLWKSFLQTLSTYEAANECGEEIISGAQYAFKKIYGHFEEVNS